MLHPNSQHLQAKLGGIGTPRDRPAADDAGSAAAGTALTNRPPPGPPCDVAIGDCDELFCAVTARLRSTVGELSAAAPEPALRDAARRAQASVLECVAALDQLHLTLLHELDRRRPPGPIGS